MKTPTALWTPSTASLISRRARFCQLGTSYYLGQINDPDTGIAATSLLNSTGSRYTGARKQLLGFDGQLAVPTGKNQVFLNGEYVGGLV